MTCIRSDLVDETLVRDEYIIINAKKHIEISLICTQSSASATLANESTGQPKIRQNHFILVRDKDTYHCHPKQCTQR